ncbi:acyl-CoA dehydrogenase family protein [Thauera linaloolentis]|uniref:Acyl-CoA dehydrogenase n=1 Tax=Thauera linaloolentis (strain DSM 12138 / JCM 21573 / CCUG 41526 / CIP 105981 / IAM 15112 / NBRC 102519 / 47Lol) TaxID=1123367 RepID=N6Y0R8_THAL4|nr:acyl-CoA dehydrogenase family protein [Thauera linaloolentis]ENO85105.1 acyl-CoA dehydrogenase [Thauera linaloolentis 47Lol = DSM 12138]MCM8566709.1 acyl-CoA dehydrogenase family protein [Thauera linaloolentis]
MDFEIPAELAALRQRVRAFIADEIIPMEQDPRQTAHGPTEELRLELVAKARRAGLLSAHVSPEYGGLGLDHRSKAVFFEEAGYSLLGPVALNIFAPDEGNMHLLEAVATDAQKERWLRPLAAGATRSCFCMTEPDPGAGSDPSMLATTAVRDGDDYLISGRKWFITGAKGAAFAIIMAKLEDGRATMFLADMDQPGITIERAMDTLDRCFPGGHCVVRFDGLRVPARDILGELGEGFKYAQVRLSPARLTHCMRWLGAAHRAHDIATAYARRRHAFGKPLGHHEGVGFMLADNEMDLHMARLSIWHTAWVLDQGGLGLHDSSMTKVIASEAEWRVADRCVQIMGGQGVTGETLVARIFADMRGFRIYDGPSEVHRWSIAKRILKGLHREEHRQ